MTTDLTHWRKLGLVYRPEYLNGWMASHGANPVAGRSDGALVQVYFNSRDRDNRSSVAWTEVDLSEDASPKVVEVGDKAVLGPGEPGAFDDSGASIGSVVSHEGKEFLYYVGWNLGISVPWRNSIGLAIRGPGSANFERYSLGPILDRSPEDPFTLSYPWVLQEDGEWHMWYGSHTRWGGPTEFEHVLKYASSHDGIHWQRHPEPVFRPSREGEYALSRPCVVRDNGALHMFYCARGDRYRIFHAQSSDAIHWQNDSGSPALDVSPEGWDSEMTCYPCVFKHGERWYMLYNGNDYGREGFGLAIAE